jgi:flagellar biosynthetic protein FliR
MAVQLPAELPQLAFAFALLIARLGSACMLIPGVGELELPGTIRAGFAAACAILLLPVLLPALPPMPASVPQLAGMVGAEIATGLWIGWLTRLLLQALPAAGQFIAGVTGLANVIQPDPAMGPQTTALSHALALAAPVAVFASGLHRIPLAALAGSYTLVPAGTLLPVADAADNAVGALSDAFAIALRLAAPFILAATLWQFALGLLSRLVPQLQVYFAALPGQIAGGLLLLAVLAQGLLAAWQSWLSESLAHLPGL